MHACLYPILLEVDGTASLFFNLWFCQNDSKYWAADPLAWVQPDIAWPRVNTALDGEGFHNGQLLQDFRNMRRKLEGSKGQSRSSGRSCKQAGLAGDGQQACRLAHATATTCFGPSHFTVQSVPSSYSYRFLQEAMLQPAFKKCTGVPLDI